MELTAPVQCWAVFFPSLSHAEELLQIVTLFDGWPFFFGVIFGSTQR
jgi:hypothetical protein